MPLTVSLTPSELAVEPGHAASFTLEVSGDGPDAPVELLGPAAEWAVVVPPRVSAAVSARVIVQVPRSPRVEAGPSAITVRAGGAEASATVDVLPFADLRASLSPRVNRGRSGGTHILHVENLGNRAVDASVEAAPGDDRLRVDPERSSLTLAPAEAVAVPVRVQAGGRRLAGRPRARPFTIAVKAGDAAVATDGLLVQERARWPLPMAVTGAMVAAVAALALGGGGGGPDGRVAVPTTLAGAARAPSAECPPDAVGAEGELVVQNFLFCPVSVTVAPGTELRWSNRDAAPHTVSADRDEFDTGNFGRGELRTVRFDRPGTYHYFCRLHPFMRGTVVVA